MVRGKPAVHIPGMIGLWPDRWPGWRHLRRLDGLHGADRKALIRQRPTLMQDSQGAIHPFFHHHVGRSHTVVDLIELATVCDGPVASEHAGGLDCQHGAQIRAGTEARCRSATSAGSTVNRRLYCGR